jgi:hypothetical protein
MDKVAIELVNFWNSMSVAVGAHTLVMSSTPHNGYTLVFAVFVLVGGGGVFMFWSESKS